jgi:hypothetical protein
MKSARDGELRTEFEFVYELLAQYIVTGHITFNPLPKRFKHGKAAWGRFPMEYFRGTENDLENANYTLTTMAEQLESEFDNLLHACVGHIYVM